MSTICAHTRLSGRNGNAAMATPGVPVGCRAIKKEDRVRRDMQPMIYLPPATNVKDAVGKLKHGRDGVCIHTSFKTLQSLTITE